MVDLDGASAAPAAPVSATATIPYQLAKPRQAKVPEKHWKFMCCFLVLCSNITPKGIPTEPRASWQDISFCFTSLVVAAASTSSLVRYHHAEAWHLKI